MIIRDDSLPRGCGKQLNTTIISAFQAESNIVSIFRSFSRLDTVVIVGS